MVNPLDPLTTEPVGASNVDLSKRQDFLALQEKILAPFARAAQADTTPAVAAPAKVEGIWNDFDPQILSRWTTTTDAAGAVTLRDGVTPTPGWTLGDSKVLAKCLKIGQLVRVKLVVTHGSKNLYGLASVAVVAGFPQTIGEVGRTSFVLPYPPHADGHGGFAVGVQTATGTTIDAVGTLTRHPLFDLGTNVLFGSSLSREPSPFNAGSYNGRVALNLMDPEIWNPGPPVYYAATPGFRYETPGETFVFFLKYHTDA